MFRLQLFIGASVLLLAGCSSGVGDAGEKATTTTTTATAPGRTIRGSFSAPGKLCYMVGDTGLKQGGDVVITDGADKELAAGRITADESTDRGCFLKWSVRSVPQGASGYKVHLGDLDPVSYIWSELVKGPQLVYS